MGLGELLEGYGGLGKFRDFGFGLGFGFFVDQVPFSTLETSKSVI